MIHNVNDDMLLTVMRERTASSESSNCNIFIPNLSTNRAAVVRPTFGKTPPLRNLQRNTTNCMRVWD